MFTVLNRLRGTYGWMSKINGLLLGILVYLCTSDILVSTLTAASYIIGESFGWGKWIGGIINDVKVGTEEMTKDEEGRHNGIHWLATRLFPEIGDTYQEYCILALTIRGFYWFFLVLLPLTLFGYIDPVFLFTGALILGIGFPLSVYLGNYTEDKFSIEYGYFSVKGSWEHAEVWYGLTQDLIILYILVNI